MVVTGCHDPHSVCRMQHVFVSYFRTFGPETTRLRNPKSEGLWLEAVRLERRANNNKGAESLMAKALQECPGSGVLWAEEILVAQRAEQKSECMGGVGGSGGSVDCPARAGKGLNRDACRLAERRCGCEVISSGLVRKPRNLDFARVENPRQGSHIPTRVELSGLRRYCSCLPRLGSAPRFFPLLSFFLSCSCRG